MKYRMKHKIDPQLVQLAVPLDKLVPDPKNARLHNDRNIVAVMSSYEAHGQRKPVVVQRKADDGTEWVVRAGNGQCEAARRLGWSHVAAIVVDENDKAAIAFALRDNRTADLAEWNLEVLGDALRFLGEPEQYGWEAHEAEVLMAAEWTPPANSGEDFEVPDKRVSIMFASAQWDELKLLLGAKPTADHILELIRIAKSGKA